MNFEWSLLSGAQRLGGEVIRIIIMIITMTSIYHIPDIVLSFYMHYFS